MNNSHQLADRDSKWSSKFAPHQLGMRGSLSIVGAPPPETSHFPASQQIDKTKTMYNVGVAIDIAPGRFHRSHIVTFTPRYVGKLGVVVVSA